MSFGRVFRKMGLPRWTFVGIGVSGILSAYVAILIEKIVRDSLGINEQSRLLATYVPHVVVLGLVALLIAFLYYRLKSAPGSRRGGCDQPEGKRGLILLVSRVESAMFAIEYHFKKKGTLEKVWLIPSNDMAEDTFGSGTVAVAEEIKKQCEAMAATAKRPLEVEILLPGVSPADAQDTYDQVRRVFRRGVFGDGEIIAVFTGGTKPMSVGVIMACLPAERELEYVSLNSATGSHGPFLIDYQHRAFDLVG